MTIIAVFGVIKDNKDRNQNPDSNDIYSYSYTTNNHHKRQQNNKKKQNHSQSCCCRRKQDDGRTDSCIITAVSILREFCAAQSSGAPLPRIHSRVIVECSSASS